MGNVEYSRLRQKQKVTTYKVESKQSENNIYYTHTLYIVFLSLCVLPVVLLSSLLWSLHADCFHTLCVSVRVCVYKTTLSGVFSVLSLLRKVNCSGVLMMVFLGRPPRREQYNPSLQTDAIKSSTDKDNQVQWRVYKPMHTKNKTAWNWFEL